ncbi:hypothetical protein [Alicyclobacillus dauci]|uniref:Uncharacterized protein n=1 Tax=Alicyclobacillus dauci TaxID=1475485 RepID=A0ABY6Z0L6_9BACL|nr:hypothetical protein [Alicyclobacillus dauci]WAH36413.1 hypothetical protein NZD86_19675 [Alicyclobacillus dauci]
MKNKQERSSKSRENVMERTLQDFWAKDVWNVIECPLRTEPWIYKGKNIFFDRICNASLRTELKYFFASMLIEKHYSVKTVFNNYKGVSGRMFDFFNTVMPRLNSVVDVRKEKLILQWRTYLEENGIKTLTPLRINAVDGQVRQSVTSYISVMNRFYDYMYDFYDEREEFEKDRWDVRNLGLQYNVTSVNYYLDFRKIPNVHRALVKRYIKLKLRLFAG